MASAAAKTMLIIDSDVRGAMKGFAAVSRNLSAMRREAELAAAVFGAAKLFGGLARLAKASADDEASMGRLAQAVRNTGKVVDGELTASLEQWLEVQQRATAFSDDELRNSLSILVTEMGDLDKAQRRMTLAADFARAHQVDLATASRMLGSINGENIEQLAKYVPAIREATTGMSQSAAAELLAQRAGIDYAKALGLVTSGGDKAEGVLKKYGIALGETIDEAKAFAILEKSVGGQAGTFAKSTAGELELLQHGWRDVGKEVGGLFLPMFSRASSFALKSVRALRHALKLFTATSAGPNMTSTRKLWKAAFGVEMPEAMGKVIESFTSIGTRINAFVDQVGSAKDAETLMGAVSSLAKGLREDLGAALERVGELFDKLGPAGAIAKVALIGFGTTLPLGPTLELISAISNVVGGFSTFGILLTRLPVWVSVGAGALTLLVIAAMQVKETVDLVRNNWETFVYALREGKLDNIFVFGYFFRVAKDMLKAFDQLGGGWAGFLNALKTAAFEIPIIGGFIRGLNDVWSKLMEIWSLAGKVLGGGGPTPAQQFIDAVGGGRAQLSAVPVGGEFMGTRGDGTAIYRLPDGRIVTSGTASLVGGGGGGVIEAARGFQGIVRGPQMFLAGEGATPEAVSITPLRGGRPSGQGPSVSVTIQGPILGSAADFVDYLERELGRRMRLYAAA
jgi:hypothetical protein